jgi:hypothetical protein
MMKRQVVLVLLLCIAGCLCAGQVEGVASRMRSRLSEMKACLNRKLHSVLGEESRKKVSKSCQKAAGKAAEYKNVAGTFLKEGGRQAYELLAKKSSEAKQRALDRINKVKEAAENLKKSEGEDKKKKPSAEKESEEGIDEEAMEKMVREFMKMIEEGGLREKEGEEGEGQGEEENMEASSDGLEGPSKARKPEMKEDL